MTAIGRSKITPRQRLITTPKYQLSGFASRKHLQEVVQRLSQSFPDVANYPAARTSSESA
jgi:hypothetical protein